MVSWLKNVWCKTSTWKCCCSVARNPPTKWVLKGEKELVCSGEAEGRKKEGNGFTVGECLVFLLVVSRFTLVREGVSHFKT